MPSWHYGLSLNVSARHAPLNLLILHSSRVPCRSRAREFVVFRKLQRLPLLPLTCPFPIFDVSIAETFLE